MRRNPHIGFFFHDKSIVNLPGLNESVISDTVSQNTRKHE